MTDKSSKNINPFVGESEGGVHELFNLGYFNYNPILVEKTKVLSAMTIRVFLYILIELKKTNVDYVELTPKELQRQLSIRTQKTVTTAFRELEDIGLIQRKTQKLWWVNPYLLWVGDTTYFKDVFKDKIRRTYPKLYLAFYNI